MSVECINDMKQSEYFKNPVEIWKSFIDGYEISKDSCDIRSMGSSHIFGRSKVIKPPKVRKVQKNGCIAIRGKGYKPASVYKEVYGVEWNG